DVGQDSDPAPSRQTTPWQDRKPAPREDSVATTVSKSRRTAGWRALIHRLNQRYRAEWDRAERLQAELDHIQRSRAWRILCWLRKIKSWFRREADAPARATAPIAPAKTTEPDAPAGASESRTLACASGSVHGKVSIVIPFRDHLPLLRNL